MSDDKKVIFSMVKVNKETPAGKQILKDVYLSFFYGAKIGILGLNGSGKSTLLKIIAGIDNNFSISGCLNFFTTAGASLCISSRCNASGCVNCYVGFS